MNHWILIFLLFLNRSHTLQADSNEVLNAWISALHKRIDAALAKHEDSDSSLNPINDSLPGAKRIQKMYAIFLPH